MSIVQDVRECFGRQISPLSHMVISEDAVLRSQVAELEAKFGPLPSEFTEFLQQVGVVEMFYRTSPVPSYRLKIGTFLSVMEFPPGEIYLAFGDWLGSGGAYFRWDPKESNFYPGVWVCRGTAMTCPYQSMAHWFYAIIKRAKKYFSREIWNNEFGLKGFVPSYEREQSAGSPATGKKEGAKAKRSSRACSDPRFGDWKFIDQIERADFEISPVWGWCGSLPLEDESPGPMGGDETSMRPILDSSFNIHDLGIPPLILFQFVGTQVEASALYKSQKGELELTAIYSGGQAVSPRHFQEYPDPSCLVSSALPGEEFLLDPEDPEIARSGMNEGHAEA